MKRLFLLSVMLLISVAEWAESKLVIEPITVECGETVTVYVSLENEEDINMVQFFFRLPDGLSLAGKPTLVSDRVGTHDDGFGEMVPNNISISYNNKDGEHRLLIADKDENQPFCGNAGAIFTLKIKASENMSPGIYKMSVVEQILGTVDEVAFEAEPYDIDIVVDVPNAIGGVKSNEKMRSAYTIGGVKMEKESIKGIYIINGKKVVRK